MIFPKFPVVVYDKNSEEVQKSIYKVDILSRFVVLCPSWLNTLSLEQLRYLFYSKAPEY